ncbi:MAG TPA: polyprenyl synthetase family protein [Pseudonocardiaceae bacterium]|nr:polyprenyl synthetase family protein [Pseudonocardiaceae bacterium]
MTGSARATTTLEDMLSHYRQQALAEIERHLPSGEPRQWLYEPMAEYPRRTGKGLRAALCLATCGAYGGSEGDAVAAAAAIELAHNAFLIHDDIQDGSAWRRGGPTLHQREGMPLALNAGDALAMLSFEVLRSGGDRLGRRLSSRIVDEFCSAMWRTLEGQALELGWRRDGVTCLSPQDYLELVAAKTCWYTTIAPLRIGALIGSWGNADLGALSRFGLFLGAAFQITDDVLNLTGGQAVYGKEIRGDLREGKRTLMIIHLLSVAEPALRDAVVSLMAGSDADRTDDRLHWLAGLLEEHGSITFAKGFARGVADGAEAAFPEAFRSAIQPDKADVIRHLVDYVVERTR